MPAGLQRHTYSASLTKLQQGAKRALTGGVQGQGPPIESRAVSGSGERITEAISWGGKLPTGGEPASITLTEGSGPWSGSDSALQAVGT